MMEKALGVQIPGVVWTVLLVALPLLAAWLDQFWAGAKWAGPVAGLLLIIAKTVEVVRASEPVPPGASADFAPRREPSPAVRWLFG